MPSRGPLAVLREWLTRVLAGGGSAREGEATDAFVRFFGEPGAFHTDEPGRETP
jgi:hypothetical protein